MDTAWRLGCSAGCLKRCQSRSRDSANDRQHDHQSPSSGCWSKRGTQKEGLGRSKGGFTSKIHLRTNAEGLPIALEISEGQTSDYKGYAPLMEWGGPDAKVLLADKGYDANSIRDDMEKRGGYAMIPMRKNRKEITPVDDFVYGLRNQVERCFNKLKNARRVATRYDKTMLSFLGFVQVTSIRVWVKHFVNRT